MYIIIHNVYVYINSKIFNSTPDLNVYHTIQGQYRIKHCYIYTSCI